jgi:hypothetical protein
MIAVPITVIAPVVVPMIADIAEMFVSPILPLASIGNSARQVLDAVTRTSRTTDVRPARLPKIGAPWLPNVRPPWPTDVAGTVTRRTRPANVAGSIARRAWSANIAGPITRCTGPTDIRPVTSRAGQAVVGSIARLSWPTNIWSPATGS